ncbi:N-acetylglucosamine-6-phosphate deacetylase [Salinithrix halophila]|uniref:N-acetylglucosamine-6-phosphate deacetylase n=1 Tax=Salinithrix halophila TaxID=1485204 RepID=A0ABV8JBT8_9BACL
MSNQPATTVLRDLTVHTESDRIETGYVILTGGTIRALGRTDEWKGAGTAGARVLSLPGYHLVPGMIDIHIHGADGADVMDATPTALETIASALPREGTTSFLATTLTQAPHRIEQALSNAAAYRKKEPAPGKAEMLGIHLEGPFISKKRAGAQPTTHIHPPDLSILKQWQALAEGAIRIVTLAPEEPGALALIHWLREADILPSIGHSDATLAEMDEAVRAGALHVTHLYNGMRGIHHREPGVAGAALLRDELTAELIADGIHCRQEMIELAFRMKTRERLILITDAMRAKCLKNGTYDLGGQSVLVEDGKATLPDGTLAGSILKMGDAVKNMIRYAGCTLEDISYMTAVNPARQLGVFDRKGSIAPGKDADLVILDPNFSVAATFCRGQLSYEKKEAPLP